MDIVFKGRHTAVLDRFRSQAEDKLARIEKLDHKAIRVDVAVTTERNPRQAQQRERVELTISSRGPAIRAEAAAEDRYAALDIAFAKLESRLRRASERRKSRHSGHETVRVTGLPVTPGAVTGDIGGPGSTSGDGSVPRGSSAASGSAASDGPGSEGRASGGPAGESPAGESGDDVVPVAMEGDGPLVVREKFHQASPMPIDQALFEMELVGHDFFLFRDVDSGCPSVVYRRRGYQYGVIRLVDTQAGGDGSAGQAQQAGGRREHLDTRR